MSTASQARVFQKERAICTTRLGAVLGDTSWTEVGVVDAVIDKPAALLYVTARGRIERRIPCKSLEDAMERFGNLCVMSMEGDKNERIRGTDD